MMLHAAADTKQSPSSSSTSSTSTLSSLPAGETLHEGTSFPPCLTPPASPVHEEVNASPVHKEVNVSPVPPTNASPPPPPPMNDETYLDFADASITNSQFHYFMHTAGEEAHMQDYCLDMALKILEHKSTATHISIASTFESQIFYSAAKDTNGLGVYSTKFANAKWIFIPINDGMAGNLNDVVQGAHWSLLVLNRIGKTAHYFDSLFVESPKYHQLADTVFRGIVNVLGEDVNHWVAKVEFNSPNQAEHNLCTQDAYSSCGPFVYEMTNYLLGGIEQVQRLGIEDQAKLDLDDSFPRWWGTQWDSRLTRSQMQDSVAQMKNEVAESVVEDVE